MKRGFTLIETMVVVAILGVIAALALPTFVPLRYRAESYGTAHAVGDFLARARSLAMTGGRCTRVRILNAGPPTELRLEQLNAFDCGDSTETPLTALRADGAAPGAGNLWLVIEDMRVDDSSVAFLAVPTETSAANHPDGTGPVDEVRFRSTGRLYSNDNDLTDDDAVFRVSHPLLTGGANTIDILVESYGRICIADRGVPIPDTGGDYRCP